MKFNVSSNEFGVMRKVIEKVLPGCAQNVLSFDARAVSKRDFWRKGYSMQPCLLSNIVDFGELENWPTKRYVEEFGEVEIRHDNHGGCMTLNEYLEYLESTEDE